MKIEKKNRMAWINFSYSYIHAAEAISEKIKIPTDQQDEEWRNEVMIIPFLYLLRHAMELALKSIFISHDKDFEKEHNLDALLKGARVCIGELMEKNEEKWSKIEEMVKEFSQTTYGGKKLFNDDSNSIALRYLQVDSINNYSELKTIDHAELLKKVRTAAVLCEAFTLHLDISLSGYTKN